MNIDPLHHDKLLELRSMKDFAAICQFLHMFHPAFALDDFETEDLEQALVDPNALAYLVDLQARMLRALTQDRRISFDNWIKYCQKEFEKRGDQQNPWIEEEAHNYESFSLATKLMILTNLCEWQLDDPDRFRSILKVEDDNAIDWRVDPIGIDAHERIYWLFDGKSLYRENPPPKRTTKKSKPAPPPPPKAAPEPRRGIRRSERGQKAEAPSPVEMELEFEPPPITPGVEWEPVCITRQEWEEFATTFKRSKHPDEKALHSFINNDILPKVLEDMKEKEKEREKLEAVANRKRSSRIVIRELELQEKARLNSIRQQEIQEAAEQRRLEIRERRAEKDRQQQQQIRENRLKEREQRLKDRENAIWEREEKKKQQQAKIAKERENRKKKRLEGGHTKEEDEDETMSRTDDQEEEEEEDWVFDCVCGVFGNNLDDGQLMIACGKCNVWQHVACVKQEDANQGRKVTNWDKVDFICPRCGEKEKKRIARKEKKDEKLRLEAQALANSGAASASAPPAPVKGKPGRKPKVATNGLVLQTHPHASTSLMSPPMVHAHPYQTSPYSGHGQPYHSPPLQPLHVNNPIVGPQYPQHPQQTPPHTGAPQHQQHQSMHQQHSLPSAAPFATPYTPSHPQHPGYTSYTGYPAQSTAPSMHAPVGYNSSMSSNNELNISTNGASGHSSFPLSTPHQQQYPPQLSSTYGQHHVPRPTPPTFATNGHPGHEPSRNGPNLVLKRTSIADENMEDVERPPKMLNQA
ncbi:hypothetical protein BGZ93_001390 [Podila epicladia]|nr:hypothetical protein BGZ93_001390 [Podila epicladia]